MHPVDLRVELPARCVLRCPRLRAEIFTERLQERGMAENVDGGDRTRITSSRTIAIDRRRTPRRAAGEARGVPSRPGSTNIGSSVTNRLRRNFPALVFTEAPTPSPAIRKYLPGFACMERAPGSNDPGRPSPASLRGPAISGTPARSEARSSSPLSPSA